MIKIELTTRGSYITIPSPGNHTFKRCQYCCAIISKEDVSEHEDWHVMLDTMWAEKTND